MSKGKRWSASARRLGKITNSRVVKGTRATFNLLGVGLPLDKVWAGTGTAITRPLLGSDHLGVVADVWPS